MASEEKEEERVWLMKRRSVCVEEQVGKGHSKGSGENGIQNKEGSHAVKVQRR